MDNNSKQAEFKPYIPADKVMPEFTATAIILGAILAVVFGAANAYLGLRVGMTVSASIPAAVISMGIIRVIMRKESILENNMVQTIGSAGESLAAGAIFTLPAIFMWADEGIGTNPSYMVIAMVAVCGGLLGIVFMIPLRKALIVKEHGTLPYPEGTACAEVLIAGEEGGTKAGTVFAGLGIAALYKFIADGLKLFPSEVDYEVPALPGAGIGMDVLPALAGVGYICGAKISSYMMAGGVMAWFVMMPAIKLLGGDAIIFPSDTPISEMGVWDIWSNYVRYIGAGAVATGGIISLIKSLPLIVKTFSESIKSLGTGNGDITLDRTSQDLPLSVVAVLLVIALAVLVGVPSIPLNLLSGIIVLIFGFFFATVSSRMVGLVGSSNNPVSGMAIATLLIATILLKSSGLNGPEGMVAAIMIGTVICIIAAMAGDMSQDLKTGYLVGATPKKQQYGEIVGVISSGLAIAGVLYLLNSAWGYGSKELPAPQATLMKLVIEGVMGSNLPWGLVFTGVFIAVVIEILQIPVLPVAIGLYLPIHLSTPLMAGGLLKLYIEKKKFKNEQTRENVITSGILYSSGLIAGEGLVGIILAVFAVIGLDPDISGKINLGNIGGLVFFAGILATMLLYTVWNKKVNK
ncbi:MAG: oligopeptide transporter, OPT family [Peptostreptococcaceae bacterium]|nr:oligopeptide transporter, OPT family [Peptostreptococcaceae bacterium]MDY5739330.1 oligopeptide transporter, OPT family [Anaerovoracaceae bacterium]